MKPPMKRSRPLYWRVADDITAKIDSGTWQPGDKLPSERALCEQYSVSQITIRRALRELTHAGRVYSHHGLGWFVGQGSSVDERHIAVFLSEMDRLAAPLLERVATLSARAGLSVQLHVVDSVEQAPGPADEAAAMIFVSGCEKDLKARYATWLDQEDIPVLCLLRELPGVPWPSVVVDEQGAMQELTRHILRRGHRRVAYVGSDPSRLEGQECYRGFAPILWEHGLELPLDWVFTGSLLEKDVHRRFVSIFHERYRPTAVVCASDMSAAEAVSLLGEADVRCPRDVAIVGLGDAEFAPLLSPPLTTFRYDLDRVAELAVSEMTELLAGRAVEGSRVAGQLVVRGSCGGQTSAR